MSNKRVKPHLLTCMIMTAAISISAVQVEASNYTVSSLSSPNREFNSDILVQTINTINETYETRKEEIAEAERARIAAEEAEKEMQRQIQEAARQTPVYSNGGGLTRSGGVNYHNGWRETWYSSNVLYHYRTGEWTVGADGVYRDSDGYVIVSSSSEAQGSITDTSFGPGKVYDTGCAPGTHDIYTNW